MIARTPTAGRGDADGRETLREHAYAARVVGAVGQHERPLRDHLQTAGHGRGGQRLAGGGLVEAAEEQAHGGDRQRRVRDLVQGRRRHTQAGPALLPAGLRCEQHGEVVGCAAHGEVARPGGAAQEVRRRAGGGADPARLILEPVELAEHGVPAFDDGGLLGEDQLSCVAEDLGVLEGDVGEHHDRRLDHVGGVQTPAQPRLERDDLHPALGEREQGGDGQHLELRRLAELRRQTGHLGAHSFHRGRERRLSDRTAVDDDALRPAGDVRR